MLLGPGHRVDTGEIYKRLHTRLKADGLPEPQQRGTATADLLGLVRNRRPAAPPVAPLPDEIKEGLDSRFSDFRLAAVRWLGEWLNHADQAHVRAAVIALRNVADNDNPSVAGAAKALLADKSLHPAQTDRPAELKRPEVIKPTLSNRPKDVSAEKNARRLATEAEQATADAPGHLRASVLADVAFGWALVDPAKARQAAVKAEQAASAYTGQRQLAAMADVALAWTTLDLDRALSTVAKMNKLTDAIDDVAGIQPALAELVRAWAAVNPQHAQKVTEFITLDYVRAQAELCVVRGYAADKPIVAEQIARNMSIGFFRARALSEVARAWAATDSVRARKAADDAARVAATISLGFVRVEVLADVARAWVAVDRVRAADTAQQAEELAIDNTSSAKPAMWVDVTRAWACVLPEEAERVAVSITEHAWRAKALAEAARGWAPVDPAIAERVAAGISDPVCRAQALAEIARAWAKRIPLE